MSTEVQPYVVYVDDDPMNLRVFEATFRRIFRLATFTSGEAALQKMPELGDIAAVLSDQRMPGMSGVELLARSRDIAPEAMRMLVTAYSDIQAVIDAVNRGQVSRYFVKPWVKEELQAAIDDAVRIYQLQARVRWMETRLLQSERLATIGQVSAGIAHELMNPVAYVTQNLSTLRGELSPVMDYAKRHSERAPSPTVDSALGEIPQIVEDLEGGVKHIHQVALKIREQARGASADTSCDLAVVADFASRIARAELRGRARLLVDVAPAKVRISQVSLCQVLLNLIINAAHAMEGKERPGRIEVRWREEGERIRLSVADDGCGIPPELRERVFEPLFTTKPVGVGTGLGLSITRDLVTQCGGELSLRSEVNVGTTIEISLAKA